MAISVSLIILLWVIGFWVCIRRRNVHSLMHRMKYEIDITNPASLRESEAELTRLLKIVRFALEGYEKRAQVEARAPGANIVSGAPDAWISSALSSVGAQFTSSEIYRYMEKNHPNVSRDVVKGILRDRVKNGAIAVLTYGRGRIPTIYRKTH